MLAALAKAGWSGEATAFDATSVKAQRAAQRERGPALLAQVRLTEMASSTLKAAQRTVEGLWSTIGRPVDTATPNECAYCLTTSGSDQINRNFSG